MRFEILSAKKYFTQSIINFFKRVQFSGTGLLARPYFYHFTPNCLCALVVALSEKKQLTFSMAIENVELMHECV